MAQEVFKNDPTTTGSSWSTLASGYTSGATSLSITSNTPYPAADPTTTPATQFRFRIDNELFVCTDNRTTTWTVAGAQGGSSAASHSSGATVTHVVSKTTLDGFVQASALANLGLGIYGDGSDGTVTFDGTTTILGLAPSSSKYTLTRDIYLAAGTINSGVTINYGGFRIFCQGTLTNNGTIAGNGQNGGAGGTQNGGAGPTGSANNGTGTIGPAANASGASSYNGRAGATGAGGAGLAVANSLGAASGAGGAGNSGAGGAAGTVSLAAQDGSARSLPGALGAWQGYNGLNAVNGLFTGGVGGGGGGGDGTNFGGGGGAGGGVVGVYARLIAGTGAIQARGGNGAAGSGSSTAGAGGGGGGGGGAVIVVSASISGGAIAGQTIDANAGTGGTKNGTAGVNGSAGSNGNVILIPN